MSRHLADCAGDDYCDGECRYNGIAQPAILERAKDISCDCDWRQLHHDRACRSTPHWFEAVDFCEFDPSTPFWPIKFWQTWNCVQHGRVGEINGPVHYEVCHV